MFFWSSGKRVEKWQVTHDNKQKTLVLQYSFFALFFIFVFTWGEEWYLLSDQRSEDVRLTRQDVEKLYQPNKPPQVSAWEKYSLIGLLVIFGFFMIYGLIIR